MASDKHPRPEERHVERSDPLDASESTDDSTTSDRCLDVAEVRLGREWRRGARAGSRARLTTGTARRAISTRAGS